MKKYYQILLNKISQRYIEGQSQAIRSVNENIVNTKRHGRGFSRSNLNYMRLFYLFFPICETLSHKLTWSHYCELVKDVYVFEFLKIPEPYNISKNELESQLNDIISN